MEFAYEAAPEQMGHGKTIDVARAMYDQLVDPAVQPAPTPGLPTLFIAGDSTAARNNGAPVQSWGEPFADYFDPKKINIANRAGGKSIAVPGSNAVPTSQYRIVLIQTKYPRSQYALNSGQNADAA